MELLHGVGNVLMLWDDQVQKLTYNSSNDLSEVAVELYHVRYWPTTEHDQADVQTVASDGENFNERESDEQAAVTRAVRIHKAILSPPAIKYSLTNRGGLSAKDGWMCWSAIDRVLCGRITSSGSIVDVSTMLLHDAVAGSICHGM